MATAAVATATATAAHLMVITFMCTASQSQLFECVCVWAHSSLDDECMVRERVNERACGKSTMQYIKPFNRISTLTRTTHIPIMAVRRVHTIKLVL